MNKEAFNLYGRIISAVIIGIFLSLAVISGIFYMVSNQISNTYYHEGYKACMQGKDYSTLPIIDEYIN